MKTPISAALVRFAGGLRFPKLLALTAVLFVANVFVPDMLPFADEALLGLVALLLAALKKRRGDDADAEDGADTSAGETATGPSGGAKP